jgi:hypothetical protein
MLFHEPMCEHEQMSKTKSFLKYCPHIDKIFGDVEEYFSMGSWMNDIYG